MAFGDFGFGAPGVGEAASQGDALGGEAGIGVADHFGYHLSHRVPDAFDIADGRRQRMASGWIAALKVDQAFSRRSVARASVAKFRKSAESRAFAATLSQNTADHSMASRH